jgi:hypothetical protein
LVTTRQGTPKITDRLNAYLAGVISVYHLKQAVVAGSTTDDVAAILETHVDAIIKLETVLHKQGSALAQALSKK